MIKPYLLFRSGLKNDFFLQTKQLCSKFPGDKKSLYEVLGVSPNADGKEIKDAFFAKSKKLHPDLNPEDPDAPENFRVLAAAYEVLSDDGQRRKYDVGRKWAERKVNDVSNKNRGQERGQRSSEGRHSEPFGRRIEVDLSQERMAKAWEAYKKRWAKEEARLAELDKKKQILREVIDEARKRGYENMAKVERDKLKEDMRNLRFPNKDLRAVHSRLENQRFANYNFSGF